MKQERKLAISRRHYSPSASVSMPAGSWLMPMLIVLALLCGLSGGIAVFSVLQAEKAERETRMLEYYLLELDAKVIKAGVKPADESIANKLKKEK